MSMIKILIYDIVLVTKYRRQYFYAAMRDRLDPGWQTTQTRYEPPRAQGVPGAVREVSATGGLEPQLLRCQRRGCRVRFTTIHAGGLRL
jgi:hypothetical protein